MKIIRLFHCINRLPFFGNRKKTLTVGYALTLSISINPREEQQLYDIIPTGIKVSYTMLDLFYLRVVLIHFNITDMFVLADFKGL